MSGAAAPRPVHVVLLGDSVFDNGAYVPGGPPVIEQLRGLLPAGARATLLAVDGDLTADVGRQLGRLPADASHLVVSAGGNDALAHLPVLDEPAATVAAALARFAEIRAAFGAAYGAMLRALLATGKPVAACTVYDRIPGLPPAAQAGLALFNEVILREAVAAGVPLLDLRIACDRPEDFSELSPIEPSARGGAKIAALIRDFVTGSRSAGPPVHVLT